MAVKGNARQTFTRITLSIAHCGSPRKLMMFEGVRIPQWTRHQLMTL